MTAPQNPAPTPQAASAHAPVLLDEAVAGLAIVAGGLYVDATFGGGGYSAAMLEAADCRVCAIDRDPDALRRGAALTARFATRLQLIEGCFGDMDRLVSDRFGAPDNPDNTEDEVINPPVVNGVAMDLGVSSPQLDDPARGFSFRFDGPLDMRMGPGGESAADLVNAADEGALADIIYHYGEERHSRRIARAIVEARSTATIDTTARLAEIVRRAIPSGRGAGRKASRKDNRKAIDPATRTFQALRIYVNDELGELDRGLRAAERLLSPGGRLAVVSFHSLEDRRVKVFLRDRAGRRAGQSRHAPPMPQAAPMPPSFIAVTRKPIRPGEAEQQRNPRARSARLRIAERTDAPAWDPAWDEGDDESLRVLNYTGQLNQEGQL